MAAKRDLASITEPSENNSSSPSQPFSKRARNNGNGPKNPNTKKQQQQQHEPATDITYGQRCCFPGLGDAVAHSSDEELDFEDETDALAYLQSVRHEASGIPHLLVAPRSGPQLPARGDDAKDDQPDRAADGDGDRPVDRSIYRDGRGDARGYYKDGAYTAAPDPVHEAQPQQPSTTTATTTTSQSPSPDETAAHNRLLAETAYFASLASSFALLRSRLHQPPPPGALASLPASRSPHVGRFGPQSRTFGVWSARLRSSDPAPAQVAAMTKDGVLRVLRVLLGGRFLRRGVEVRERTSRWAWALLARLPDRGELDYAEVGTVRELGKRAALLLWSLREMDLLREEVDGEAEVEGEGEGEGEVDLELVGHGDGADEEQWAGEDAGGDDDNGEGVGEAESDGERPLDRGVPANDRDEPEAQAQARAPAPAPSGSDSAPDPTINSADSDSDSDADMEDGEITETPAPTATEPLAPTPPAPAPASAPQPPVGESIESAKARLLANLDSIDGDGEEPEVSDVSPEVSDAARARMNMRATLNMILTVAGEFYGQRDLLEFRDPFHGV